MREVDSGDSISSLISSLGTLFEHLEEIWFRGQPDYLYDLRPGIFRQGSEFSGLAYNEAEMYAEFLRTYPDHASNHKSVCEWLTLMQHYGIPTRLLDWTTNLLVALFFCCNEKQDCDGAVYALQSTNLFGTPRDFELIELQVASKSEAHFYSKLLNEAKFDNETLINNTSIKKIKDDMVFGAKFINEMIARENPFSSVALKAKLPDSTVIMGSKPGACAYIDITRAFSSVIAFRAPWLNTRLRQQHGVFTLHGGLYFRGRKFIEPMRLEAHSYLVDDLVKIKIKSSSKEKLMKELALSGIIESTLFPEMEYQAKRIRQRFTTPSGTRC